MTEISQHGDHDDAGEASPFLLLEHFEPHVGRIFQFEGTPYAMPLQSIYSSDRPVADWMKRRPFTLIFRAPRQRDWMREGYYRCSVQDGPSFGFHIAPIQTPQLEFQDYQAVFN